MWEAITVLSPSDKLLNRLSFSEHLLCGNRGVLSVQRVLVQLSRFPPSGPAPFLLHCGGHSPFPGTGSVGQSLCSAWTGAHRRAGGLAKDRCLFAWQLLSAKEQAARGLSGGKASVPRPGDRQELFPRSLAAAQSLLCLP